MTNVRLVIPVFNDWVSFRHLLLELDRVAASLPFSLSVSAVDDGSTDDPMATLSDLPAFTQLSSVEIIHLSVNLGHQRAIAVGLCIAANDGNFDAVLIMDADGEDPPQAIEALTRGIGDQSNFCFVAQRRKRVETFSFKFFYLLYKTFFKLVTGKTISFGNFCILSRSYVDRLVMVSDLWNNLPAAILRSRLIITAVPLHRGARYAGKSKMNFTSLIVHGLSSISVYADTIFVRLLMLSGVLVIVSSVCVACLLALRIFFPAHATPGWATTIAFGLAIIILQILFTALSSILMLLNSRVQRLVIPKFDFHHYVASRRPLFGRVSPENMPELVKISLDPVDNL
jgi:glycosyltransferase involved in cell wall biosynthesis